MPETDELLVHKTRHGDIEAFGRLVERHQHQVYNLAFKMLDDCEDARDITQESFVKAYSSLASFRYEAGFKTWLYRIASNTCLDHLRRRKQDRGKRLEKPPDPSWDPLENLPAGSWSDPVEKLILGEQENEVRKAIATLPAEYRMPLIMQQYQELSYRDIGAALGIPDKTVATRIFRAKKILKELLTGGEAGAVQRCEKKAYHSPGRGVQLL